MKTIKFKSTKFNLVADPNISLSHFQATVEKGENTFDDIVEESTGVTEINIYDENDERIGVYSGYSQRLAISIYGDDTVSIELVNADIQAQLNALNASIASFATVQEDQNNAIADLGSAVSNIADTQTDQGNAIADLGDVVGELADSQEAQDYAIEDLANAVSQIVEPEEGE